MNDSIKSKSLEEQLAAAKRELRMREFVYPKRVAKGQMAQWQANHEIACMDAICQTLIRLMNIESQQSDLFGEGA